MRPGVATAGLGWLSYGTAAPWAHAVRPCFYQLRRLCVQRGKWHRAEQDGARPGARCADPVWTKRNAAKEGVPPTIMAIASALPRLLTATAAPAMTWLPLNVVIVDNDRGDSPSSYRACTLRAGAQEVSRDTA